MDDFDDDNAPQGPAHDEAIEVDESKFRKKTSEKDLSSARIVKTSKYNLKTDELLSHDKGLPNLQIRVQSVTFVPGNEFNDLKRLMCIYQQWAHELQPNLNFDDFIGKCEKLGKKAPVKSFMRKLRHEGESTNCKDNSDKSKKEAGDKNLNSQELNSNFELNYESDAEKDMPTQESLFDLSSNKFGQEAGNNKLDRQEFNHNFELNSESDLGKDMLSQESTGSKSLFDLPSDKSDFEFYVSSSKESNFRSVDAKKIKSKNVRNHPEVGRSDSDSNRLEIESVDDDEPITTKRPTKRVRSYYVSDSDDEPIEIEKRHDDKSIFDNDSSNDYSEKVTKNSDIELIGEESDDEPIKSSILRVSDFESSDDDSDDEPIKSKHKSDELISGESDHAVEYDSSSLIINSVNYSDKSLKELGEIDF